MSVKVILITGCSSGFGLLTAVRLAAQGHTVYATMRDTRKKDFLLIEAERLGCASRIIVLPLDVTDPESIRVAVNDILARSGVIDVLINNAGFGVGGFFEDLSAEDWKAQFDVNFFGTLNVTREVLPAMRPRRKGLIINISSLAAFSGSPCFSAYCSSKFALEGFSECLYMELEPLGIKVALVEPGSYKTKIFEENASYAKRYDDPQSPYFTKSQYLRDMVMGHIRNNNANPDDVAIKIERIINAHQPSFRNIIGLRANLRFWLMKFMPFKLYSTMVNGILQPHA